MITYVRKTPFPKCKYCGIRLTWYDPWLPDEDHAHPACIGEHLADKLIENIKKEIHANNN